MNGEKENPLLIIDEIENNKIHKKASKKRPLQSGL
jgi:hypothetical protein